MKDNRNHDPTRMNDSTLLGRIIWHLVRQLGGQAMIPAAVWATIGREMGFRFMTVRPVSGKGPEYFTAELTEGDS